MYLTHIAGRDSTTLMAYAARTERVLLGTGVMPIYSRTPVAYRPDVRDARRVLETAARSSGSGCRTAGRGGVVRAALEKPLRDTREYVGDRARDPARRGPAQGEGSAPTFHFKGFEPRADLPIYLGGLSPKMLRLAGEIADGVVL